MIERQDGAVFEGELLTVTEGAISVGISVTFPCEIDGGWTMLNLLVVVVTATICSSKWT